MRHDHSIIACLHHIYMGVVLRSHSVRGEPHIQHNVNGEVAKLLISVKCACVKLYPWVHCTQWNFWRTLPLKQSDCLWTSWRNICISPKSQISLQPVIQNHELKHLLFQQAKAKIQQFARVFAQEYLRRWLHLRAVETLKRFGKSSCLLWKKNLVLGFLWVTP